MQGFYEKSEPHPHRDAGSSLPAFSACNIEMLVIRLCHRYPYFKYNNNILESTDSMMTATVHTLHTLISTCTGADIFNITSIEVDDIDGLGRIRMQLISVSLVETRFRWISGLLGVTGFYRTAYSVD